MIFLVIDQFPLVCLSIYFFFSFPEDPDLRKKWAIATRRKNFIPSSSTKICSEHFTKDSYEVGGLRKRLKKDAIPSLFEFPAHLLPSTPKKRRQIIKIQVNIS